METNKILQLKEQKRDIKSSIERELKRRVLNALRFVYK